YTIHSDLGRIVQAVSREFEKHPPALLNESGSNSHQNGSHSTTEQDKRNAAASPSGEPDVFGLQALTLEELARLNSDEDYLEGLSKTKRQLIMDRREKLEQMVLDFKELGEKYDGNNRKFQQKSEDFSPQHIKELLQIAVSAADSKSDEEAQKFLAGDSDVGTFLNNFIETRKKYTMRKAKEDRLVQQLTALERSAAF
ncbi:hypothetical protein pipiens_006603, partial [Culex pipiens pipiens]